MRGDSSRSVEATAMLGDLGWRYFQTFCLSAAFFVLGICIALIGPTLPTLATNLGTTVEGLSFVVTARGCGYLVGSLACAYLFRRVNNHFVVACSLLITGMASYSIPFIGHFVLLGAVVIAGGMSMGVLDTGGNVMCLALWGTESESWMQMLHFFFAFGATLAPLIAKPFIHEADQPLDSTHSPNATASVAVESTTVSEAQEAFPFVAWAFIIAASLNVLVSLTFCYLCCSGEAKTESAQEDTTKLEGIFYRLKVLGLLFFFYLLYVGTEVAFGLFIYYFAINCDKHYSKDTGTLLNSVFWGVFALGRFCAIFFAKCMTPKTMLVLDLAGTTISTFVMALLPYFPNGMDWILWAAVALYGWSMASLFPTGITWAEQYITVTGNAATSFVVGAALGEMLLPFAMSYLVTQNPMNLMYFCLSSNSICIVIFVCLVIITNRRGSRHDMQKTSSNMGLDRVDNKYNPVPTSSDYDEEVPL